MSCPGCSAARSALERPPDQSQCPLLPAQHREQAAELYVVWSQGQVGLVASSSLFQGACFVRVERILVPQLRRHVCSPGYSGGVLIPLFLCVACRSATPPLLEGADLPQSADVIGVTVDGEPGAYRFSVTIHSPDVGCARYTDWWEVVDADGALVFRRILHHSHVREQPFTRSGGPVPAEAEQPLVVRAHLNTGGYGQPLAGTPGGRAWDVPVDTREYSPELETSAPLPRVCLH